MEAGLQARCSWCLTPSQAIPKLRTYNLVCRPIHLNEWSKRPDMVLRPNLGGDSIFHPTLGPLQVKAYFPRGNYLFADACTQTICQLFACFLMPHMLFMLCVVYPFVDCFCLPICASHVHSLVVYTLYIYLSVASIYFFCVSRVYLLACLSPVHVSIGLIMLHASHVVTLCFMHTSFCSFTPHTCYVYISHNICFSFLYAISHMPCTCPCIHMLFHAYLCTFLIHACFSVPCTISCTPCICPCIHMLFHAYLCLSLCHPSIHHI